MLMAHSRLWTEIHWNCLRDFSEHQVWSMVFGNMLYFEHEVILSVYIHMYVCLSTSVCAS